MGCYVAAALRQERKRPYVAVCALLPPACSESGAHVCTAAFDYTARNLGYNTDHGSYYYCTCFLHCRAWVRGGVTVVVPTDNTEPGKNYLETLTDVYHYSQSAGIPYKFILLDSWCVIALSLPCVASLMRRWM